MPDSSFTIRPMNRPELDIAVDWAANEGWNPGLHDAETFFMADPGGFLIGLVDETPVACISVVNYGTTFAFLGFYIVHPDYRGQGYGLRIWNAGMQRLQGRTIGLDGVPDQQDNYRKSGFVRAYRNIRQEGRTIQSDPHPAIHPLDEFPIEQVLEYDGRFFPVSRHTFLHHWLQQEGSRALGYRTDTGLQGYGVIRPCRTGYKIGPLFANTAQMAERLFLALSATTPAGSPLFLDTPEPNPHALELATKYSMAPMFETARMYTGTAPDISLERTYGVTTFELG